MMDAKIRKLFTAIFCVWFAIASTMATIAHAEAVEADVQAPLIDHEEKTLTLLQEAETFVATVVDNNRLKSVILYYRYAGDDSYIDIPMQTSAGSSIYVATVDTRSRTEDMSAIEYYIRAEDTAKNVVLKGLSFAPLVREFTDSIDAVEAAIASTIDNPSAEPPAPGKLNWLYVGLGVLLVGSIAAASRSGGGDSNNSDADPGCVLDCSITLTLTTP